MKKTWILIGMLAIVAFGLVVLAAVNKSKKQGIVPIGMPTPTPVSFEISPPANVSPTVAITPSGDTVSVSNVNVNNFYQTTTPFDSQGDRTIADVTDAYKIVYLAQYQQFLISITGSPFNTYRFQAERAFLQKMNISQKDACALNVVIRTSSHINPNEAGQDFSLSFCH